ncbi:MAG TPA: 30S ribosomal protein S18 [Candidatus Tyrphobacter sp.]
MPPKAKKSKVKRTTKDRRPKHKPCSLCIEKAVDVSYRDVNRLRKYVSERGKIVPRRISGACAKHQRMVTIAVKRARLIAFLPYTSE